MLDMLLYALFFSGAILLEMCPAYRIQGDFLQ